MQLDFIKIKKFEKIKNGVILDGSASNILSGRLGEIYEILK